MVYIGALLFIAAQIATDVAYTLVDPARAARVDGAGSRGTPRRLEPRRRRARRRAACSPLLAARRSDLWRNAGRELLRRRPIALAVVAVYVLVALLDCDLLDRRRRGRRGGQRPLALHQPRSVDRPHVPPATSRRGATRRRSPTSSSTTASPLAHPGAHLLGTDILGRDVLHLTLKGARVALLIGGLTSLIVIPLALLMGVSAGYFGGRIDDVVFFVDVDARLDPHAAAADRPHHGAGARPGAGLRRHGRHELGRLLPHRARRDLQAPRARLRAGGAGARRVRGRASSCATSCRT